jgi:hypothetical protein
MPTFCCVAAARHQVISERLRGADIPFMLTGSFALGYYGKPRMTRDLDFVASSEMQLRDVRTLIDESVDWPYLKDWAAKLGVAAKLDEVSK